MAASGIISITVFPLGPINNAKASDCKYAMSIALRYSLFAVLATLLNLAAQEGAVRAYGGAYSLYLAMGVGTLVGLVSKYLLDKRFIFRFVTASPREDLGRFTRYGMTGIATTAIFWGFELGFDALIGGRVARYAGAIIGLSIGYGVKYRLDKQYVFSRRRVQEG